MNNVNFRKVAVKVITQRKINLLAAVLEKDINVLVAELVDPAWEVAKAAGQVSDAMLALPEPASEAVQS